jgi:hypothetical protein
MRFAILLLACMPVCLTGCSAIILGTGTRLDELEKRERVHQKFGESISQDESEGMLAEDYLTHRKIADTTSGIYLVMGYVGTLGLGELIWFPKASYRVIRNSIVGQHLRVFYDDQGKVQKNRT